MDDSNNHYMKLISPSNNKTLVTPEKRQNYDIMAFEDTWRGEQRRDRETGRRPKERKKKKGERKEWKKEKEECKSARTGTRDARRSRAKGTCNWTAKGTSLLVGNAPSRETRGGVRRSAAGYDGADTARGDEREMRRGVARRNAKQRLYTSLRVTRWTLAPSRARARSVRESRGTRRA